MTLVLLCNGQGELRRDHLGRLLREDAALASQLQDVLEAQAMSLHGAGDDVLGVNRFAQPAICAYQLAMWRNLAARIPRPALLAGYSLGELTAFSIAADVEPTQAIELAALRARLMDEAVSEPSGMLAVTGLKADVIDALCRRHGCEVGIRNGVESFVVGGSTKALDAMAESAAAAGASRAVRLGVAIPSHTARLGDAAARFGNALRARTFTPMRVPMVGSVDAQVVRSTASALAVLERQIHTTIDWQSTMDTIVAYRPGAVLELGPGTALSRMMLEVEPGLEVRSLDDFRSLDGAAHWIRSRSADITPSAP